MFGSQDEMAYRIIELKRLLRETLVVLEEYDRDADLINRVKKESSIIGKAEMAPWWEKQK